MLAAETGQLETVQAVLDADPNIEATNNVGGTALTCASREGHTAIVQALLDSGANIKVYDTDGWTALHSADKMGHSETVQVLVKAEHALLEKEEEAKLQDLERTVSKNKTLDIAFKNMLVSADAYKRFIGPKYLNVDRAKRLFPIYLKACEQIENPVIKSIAIDCTGQLRRFLLVHDQEDPLKTDIHQEQKNPPAFPPLSPAGSSMLLSMPKDGDIIAEVKKISNYYTDPKNIKERTKKAEDLRGKTTIHKLHPYFESDQTLEGLCAGACFEFIRILNKYPNLPPDEVSKKIAQKLIARKGGSPLPPVTWRLLILHEEQEYIEKMGEKGINMKTSDNFMQGEEQNYYISIRSKKLVEGML
jgi:hypothetical protein